MKSGPGSVSSSFGIPFDSCVSRLSASSPSRAWMSTSDSFTFGWPAGARHGWRTQRSVRPGPAPAGARRYGRRPARQGLLDRGGGPAGRRRPGRTASATTSVRLWVAPPAR